MIGAGASFSLGDKVYISAVRQFSEWGTKQCCERSEQIFWGVLHQIVTLLSRPGSRGKKLGGLKPA